MKASGLVRVLPDYTLVVLLDGKSYLEVRPTYNPGTGPALTLYSVGATGSKTYLATLRIDTIHELVRKLPIAIAAARRLASKAAQTK